MSISADTVDYREGACIECGSPTKHERFTGMFAETLNDHPLICPGCSARQQEAFERDEQDSNTRRDGRVFAEKLQTLPPSLRSWRLEQLDTTGRAQALDAARRWAEGELPGLVLIGDVGRGKSTIAAAASAEYIGRHLDSPTPRWISTVAAINDLSRGFNDRRRIDAMDALDSKRAPLILDDIDKTRPNASSAAIVFGAIDSCITHRRPLLASTNLMPDKLVSAWPAPHGEAIASRLAGYCELHRVSGPDRRLHG